MKINTKSRKVNKAWLNDHVHDPYVKLAAREGYRARAAYKLKEIDESLRLIRPGQLVVDLGCVPGAWSQYLRRRFAPKVAGVGGAASGELDGRIIALDILDFEPVDGVHFIRGDFRDATVLAQLQALLAGPARGSWWCRTWRRTCPALPLADAARMADLVELAVDFALHHLKPDGALVCKVFHGSGYSQLAKLFKDSFRVVKPIKPKASRDKSAETFLVGLGPKGA